jgi:signal transduction histidine kinase
VASVFETVNAMNAIVIMLMFFSFIFAVIAPVSIEWVAATTAAVSVMVQLALVLQIRFPDLLTFRDAFMLLTKVGLRYVSARDFRYLSNFGIDMAIILTLFTLVLFAFSGFVIGSFIANRMQEGKSLIDRLDRLIQGEDPMPQLHQEDPKAETKDDSNSNLDSEFMTSVEILAGRALTEIHDLKNEMDKQLEKAREDLVVASHRLKEIREKITVS